MTIAQYAAYRGIHRQTVLKWIKAKKIPAEQVAGRKGKYSIPLIEKGEGRFWPDWRTQGENNGS